MRKTSDIREIAELCFRMRKRKMALDWLANADELLYVHTEFLQNFVR